VNDDDLHAFDRPPRPAAAPAPHEPPAKRRPVWPWLLGTALVAMVGVGGALLVALLAVMLVVFLVVPLVLVGVLLAVGLGLGGALLAAALVAAVVLSPLWLFGLLLWLLLRRAPNAAPARMAA
jgi:hypothetical protein